MNEFNIELNEKISIWLSNLPFSKLELLINSLKNEMWL